MKSPMTWIKAAFMLMLSWTFWWSEWSWWWCSCSCLWWWCSFLCWCLWCLCSWCSWSWSWWCLQPSSDSWWWCLCFFSLWEFLCFFLCSCSSSYITISHSSCPWSCPQLWCLFKLECRTLNITRLMIRPTAAVKIITGALISSGWNTQSMAS